MEQSVIGKGIHILVDMYQTKEGLMEMYSADSLQSYCESKVMESGLTKVGGIFHQFPGEGSGVTGAVILQESHLAIHTWPEKNYVTLDVFVCNVTIDNRDKARYVANSLLSLFQPKSRAYQEIERN